MDPQPIPAALSEPSPVLADGTVTYECAHCPGRITFNRAEAHIARCPACESFDMVAVSHTIEATLTAADAIALAAQELPDKVEHTNCDQGVTEPVLDGPVQPFLPHTRPAFDLQAALDLIEQQELAASNAEKAYTAAAERAKGLRKVADAENTALRELIRDLNTRRHDARYEPKETDAEEEEAGELFTSDDEGEGEDDGQGHGESGELRPVRVQPDGLPVVSGDDSGVDSASVQPAGVDGATAALGHADSGVTAATAPADPLGTDSALGSEDPAGASPDSSPRHPRRAVQRPSAPRSAARTRTASTGGRTRQKGSQ